MSDRLNLGELDGRSVPLPHGTEVTLRVERLVNGRRVPQGLPGRVVRARDGGFDVLIAGVGEAFYTRAELLPRKPGQLEYATRRELAWQQLLPCKILEATVGSRAWGLATEGSDTDLRGAFALPFSWTAGLVTPPSDLVSADGSATYWEVRKCVRQALRADPNTLELLFVPTVHALDDLGQWLLDAREAFVSKLLFGSFGRYALSQLDKLVATQRLARHRDQVLEWLTEEPCPSLDDVALRLAKVSPRSTADEANDVLQAKTYLKQLYRSLADQGLIDANDFASMTRYARAGGRGPEDARELRPKNAYNLLRLIRLATDWLATGTPRFEATGAFREQLVAIKEGRVELNEVLAQAQALTPALETARDESRLPELPDFVRADAVVRQITQELARRGVEQAPGPFGADTPSPPRPMSNEEPS